MLTIRVDLATQCNKTMQLLLDTMRNLNTRIQTFSTIIVVGVEMDSLQETKCFELWNSNISLFRSSKDKVMVVLGALPRV